MLQQLQFQAWIFLELEHLNCAINVLKDWNFKSLIFSTKRLLVISLLNRIFIWKMQKCLWPIGSVWHVIPTILLFFCLLHLDISSSSKKSQTKFEQINYTDNTYVFNTEKRPQAKHENNRSEIQIDDDHLFNFNANATRD
jgi:hypothetical protein